MPSEEKIEITGQKSQQQNQPQPQTQPQPQSKGLIPDFTSPEALIMAIFAVSLDLIGLVLLCAALDDFWLTDIAGVLIIGSWVLTRGGGTGGLKGKKGGKSGSGIPGLKNFGIATVIEVVPYIGDISPSWSIMVYNELKRTSKY